MENRRNWKRIPMLLLTLLATAEVLSLSGPAGAAPASPLELLGVAVPAKTADLYPAQREAVSPAESLPLAAPQPEEPPEPPEPSQPTEPIADPEPPADPEPAADQQAVQPEIQTPAESDPISGSISPNAPPPVPAPPAAEPDSLPPEAAAGAVEASGAVEDTYFEDVVFLGDSRTEGFYLYSGLKTGKYLYAVGATVESVFSKNAWESSHGKIPLLDALAELDCGKVYLMLGINELGWSRVENYHDQYAKLIDRVREDHPDAVIVLQSILPVSAKQDAKGSYVNNDKIHVYNGVIAGLAEEKDCVFLDSAQAVTGEDGCLPVEWTFDGVHLNPAGCKVLLEFYRTHSI